MSLNWREWIRLKKRKELGLSEKDDQTLRDNIPLFCRISDELMRQQAGEDCVIGKEFDELPEEQKLSFTKEVIKKGLEKLKKKKKQETSTEPEETDTNAEEQGQSMLKQAQTPKQDIKA